MVMMQLMAVTTYASIVSLTHHLQILIVPCNILTAKLISFPLTEIKQCYLSYMEQLKKKNLNFIKTIRLSPLENSYL